VIASDDHCARRRGTAGANASTVLDDGQRRAAILVTG
jgi:hypothetical protein